MGLFRGVGWGREGNQLWDILLVEHQQPHSRVHLESGGHDVDGTILLSTFILLFKEIPSFPI